MKSWICAAGGAIGSFITYLVGGWDIAVITLIIFMCIDYISGWVCAAIFHKSQKTESGGYDSKVGFKGLLKKVMIILLIIVAHCLDNILGINYVRSGVCIAFMVNEGMSILENAGLMGVPLPNVITKALDVLESKSNKG